MENKNEGFCSFQLFRYFTYLRRKHSEFGHMTVTDSNGMPFYHQDDALALASDQWNQVFFGEQGAYSF